MAGPGRAHPPMTPSTHHFSIGVVNITLRSECRRLMNEYLSLYAPYRTDAGESNSIEVEIKTRKRFGWSRGPYTLRSNSVPDFEVEHRYEVLPHLEWYINWQIIYCRHEYVQLHASSLEFDGQAIILPGDPGSGKSTLAAGLLARGWGYLCDEFALIDPGTREVHPYPRALCMKEPSFPVIDRLGLPLCRTMPYQKATKGRVAFLSPLDVASDAVGRASRVRWVVFPKYVADAEPCLKPVARSWAVYELAKQCFNIQVDRARTMTTLADLIRGAECYRLTSGDIGRTCDLVESLHLCRASRKVG